MGIIDRLLGRSEPEAAAPAYGPSTPARVPNQAAGGQDAARDPDDVAVERYRYLLRTAPPDAIEQAHAEAFAALTPEQRRRVLAELSEQVPAAERAASDDPRSLARMATRAEIREPGTMERTFGGRPGMGGGMGMGGLFAGTLLASIAGSFIGTSIAGALLNDGYGDGFADGAAAADSGGEGGAEGGAEGDVGADPGMDAAADPGTGDWGGGDLGGGDFGGGDFGGGDFI